MGSDLLKDRVALVTGAGQGLGVAVAREFADEGAAVALVEINPETVGKVKAELEAKGFRCWPTRSPSPITTPMPAAMAQIVAQWGQIDILVNNAAIA